MWIEIFRRLPMHDQARGDDECHKTRRVVHEGRTTVAAALRQTMGLFSRWQEERSAHENEIEVSRALLRPGSACLLAWLGLCGMCGGKREICPSLDSATKNRQIVQMLIAISQISEAPPQPTAYGPCLRVSEIHVKSTRTSSLPT